MQQFPPTEQALIAHLLDALRALPDVRADLSPEAADPKGPQGQPSGRGYDARLELHLAGQSLLLLLAVRKAVFPRDVRQLIWQLQATSHGTPTAQGANALPLLIAQSISPGAKETLRSQRVGYYDSGGSLYLCAPGVYVYIDKPPPKSLAKTVRALFAGRRAQVLHALLMQPQAWFGVTELAQQAMVSTATASQVLGELERLDWLAVRGQGPGKQRQLREPTALLDAWAKQLAILPAQAVRRYYVPGAKADTLATRLGRVCHAYQAPYAITHEAAAQRLAPFLSHVPQVRVRLPSGASADAALAELGARPVHEGANLGIIETQPPGELLFSQHIDGLWLASPIQIYLDLLRGEGRAKEMAEHFRQERIGF
ncbi:hypothetical protein EII18_09140 [Comamonadaceae bacterium OH3737_COT-264]|nr:hypothetical protein EII18_09140 [Comamonadaceae bacterium OH3737_COT-264]